MLTVHLCEGSASSSKQKLKIMKNLKDGHFIAAVATAIEESQHLTMKYCIVYCVSEFQKTENLFQLFSALEKRKILAHIV
jgi:hypothetical protein